MPVCVSFCAPSLAAGAMPKSATTAAPHAVLPGERRIEPPDRRRRGFGGAERNRWRTGNGWIVRRGQRRPRYGDRCHLLRERKAAAAAELRTVSEGDAAIGTGFQRRVL